MPVGADVDSTYCYLLSVEDHRDQTTWGVPLLDLLDQGLNPDYTIADGGGWRAGPAAAWPKVPCHGEVFHAERELGKRAFYLGNRAKSCTGAREKLEGQIRRKARRGKGNTLSKRLALAPCVPGRRDPWGPALARQAEVKAVRLAEEVRTLGDWMQHDILSLAGPDLRTRPRGRELFDYVAEQLRQRESDCAHRIGPVVRMREHQRDQLLAFVGVLDERLTDVAARFNVPAYLVHAVCECQDQPMWIPTIWVTWGRGSDQNRAAYGQRRTGLHQKLGNALRDIEQAVQQAMAPATWGRGRTHRQNPRRTAHRPAPMGSDDLGYMGPGPTPPAWAGTAGLPRPHGFLVIETHEGWPPLAPQLSRDRLRQLLLPSRRKSTPTVPRLIPQSPSFEPSPLFDEKGSFMCYIDPRNSTLLLSEVSACPGGLVELKSFRFSPVVGRILIRN